MKKILTIWVGLLITGNYYSLKAQTTKRDPASFVNVFMGTSGDHGQLSPAASYPFSMLSIVPQTYPSIHTGYEYYAKKFLGFAHSCFEGVGCQGSGANLLVKPFLGSDPNNCELIKESQQGSPGFYSVRFENGINAAFTVGKSEGIHAYDFPKATGNKNNVDSPRGLYFDLSHSRSNGFVAEAHQMEGNVLSGWIQAGTTCSVGKYKVYYQIRLNHKVEWKEIGPHKLIAMAPDTAQTLELRIGWSSTSEKYAAAAIDQESFQMLKENTRKAWNTELGKIAIQNLDKKSDSTLQNRAGLFYSLLYRSIQSPYDISEKDGHFRATDGSLQKADHKIYNGWSVWDNYRTQLPLLSLAYSDRYKDIIQSLASLYRYGKKDYATQNEPSNTVRTEHAIVVLLDGYKKGYPIDFAPIIDSIKNEIDGLAFAPPDKALESSYDTWALGEIYGQLDKPALSREYKTKALNYKKYWLADFADLKKKDVDRMQARKMYQGTIWQYRWLVPYDLKGLMDLCGGKAAFEKELDTFFDNDYYSQANEPDIEAPSLYNATASPWKAQALMQKYAIDTVVQYYFNDNSRGIDPVVGPVYQNKPKALLRTMDDDGGAMSSWFVFAASGLFPACVGEPIYYLNVPLFEHIKIATSSAKDFDIQVKNFGEKQVYIGKLFLNGTQIQQNFLTQQQIEKGGQLVIEASATPIVNNKSERQWISSLKL